MGCTCSLSGSVHVKPSGELEDFLTESEVELVRKSWEALSDDLTDTGLLIFHRLFEQQVNLKKLFKKLMTCSESGDFIFDERKLRNHANILMQGLGAAVESLDDSAFLTNLLVAMGERHAAYNVKPDMIPFLWPAIRDAFKIKLDSKFTQETELAWRHIFDYLTCKMSEGIVRGQKELSEDMKEKADIV